MLVRLREQNGHLIAAQPRQDIRLAQAAPGARNDLAQKLIAGAVAKLVVDRLEVVDVKVRQGEGTLIPVAPVDLQLKQVVEEGGARRAR